MFTGIIETIGKVVFLKKDKGNLRMTISSPVSNEFKIDQSIAHNGICFTVIEVNNKDRNHTVTAVNETLRKTSLHSIKTGDLINMERCVKVGDRLDGHILLGHIDTTAICKRIEDQNGSWLLTFEHPSDFNQLTVEKGSIGVNGISLTVLNASKEHFSVAIIPYTYEHTNLKTTKIGDLVNIEFDIIGKYVLKSLNSGHFSSLSPQRNSLS
jgi:riboflavin synthase